VTCFHKSTAKGRGQQEEKPMHTRQGFTLVEIMIVVAIIGLLAAIAVPSFLQARETARRNACINNLRQIDGAKDQYALEYGGGADLLLTSTNIAIYIKDMNKCFCPLLVGTNRTFDNSYSINVLTAAPTCKVGTNKNHDLSFSSRG
jgi:prepilin-type N-terminal cleavage/methylation domain-containing protein